MMTPDDSRYFGSFMDSMMGGGSRSFGKNNLETLLENPEKVTLEEVLNDSEILTECKWGNTRLVN
jgi:hypothetical protein